jgi:hypothetical protein
MPEKTVKRRLQNAGDAAFDVVLQRQNVRKARCEPAYWRVS